VSEDEALARFGLHPPAAALAEIRELLRIETVKESRSQGEGDTDLMRLLCVCLFNAGDPADSLAIWAAKRASMDANAAIDLQLLCGGGIEPTKAHLRSYATPEATAALRRIVEGEASGEFEEFSVSAWSTACTAYYG
jgi:hypothetical protein